MLDFDPSTVALPSGHDIGGMHLAPASHRLAVPRPSDLGPCADLPVVDAEIVDHAVPDLAWAGTPGYLGSIELRFSGGQPAISR